MVCQVHADCKQMSAIKKLAGQTALYGLSSIVGRMLNYLLVPFYTRIFSPAEYGIVSELYAYSSFLLIIFTYGMETAFFHFMNKEENKDNVYSTSLSSVLYTSLFLSGIMIVFSSPLASLIKYPKHPEYITWLALILAFDAVSSIPFARLRQLNKAKQFALLKIVNILLNIGFNIFFLVICPKYINSDGGLITRIANSVYSPSIGMGYVFVSNVLASGLTLLTLFPLFKNISLKPDVELVKRMLVYAFPLLIAGFAGMINETFDRTIYKYLAPNQATALKELGIYSACYKLSIIMTLFIQTFRYAAEPFFFAQHKQDDKRDVYARVMKYFVITCAFIFLGVMLYIDVVKIFIGESFRSGLGVVPILLMANLCLGVFYNLSMWYKLTGQTRYGAYFAIFGGVLTVILLFVLIPTFGYMGAAWATLITYAAMMVMSYITGQKNHPIPYDVKGNLFYVLLALGFYGLSLALEKILTLEGVFLFTINTILLIVFAGVVYRLNKPQFSKVVKPVSTGNTYRDKTE